MTQFLLIVILTETITQLSFISFISNGKHFHAQDLCQMLSQCLQRGLGATVKSYPHQSRDFDCLLEGPSNRPFSYSESVCGSNDISLQFVEFSNVHNCD